MKKGEWFHFKRFLPNSTQLMSCSNYKRKGHVKKNWKDSYKDSKLLTIWFEGDNDGSFKLDANGQR